MMIGPDKPLTYCAYKSPSACGQTLDLGEEDARDGMLKQQTALP